MNSFTFTNPYSQSSLNASSSSSWQHQVRVFLQNASGGGAPSLESIERLYQVLQQQQQQSLSTLDWTWDVAAKFVNYCHRLVLAEQRQAASILNGRANSSSPVLASLLYVMIKALEQSDDAFTYASMAMMQENHSSSIRSDSCCNLLNFYHELFLTTTSSSSSLSAISSVACVGLASAWCRFDRIDRLTSLDPCTVDSTWWLETPMTELASAVVALLLRNELEYDNSTNHIIPNLEEIQMSCVGILSTLLKHNLTDWLFYLPDEQRQQFVLWLRRKADRLQLDDRSMTPSLHTLELAFSCAGLLFLISWKHSDHHDYVDQWKVQWSNEILSHIVRVAFPSVNTTPRGPRWTYESPTTVRLLQPWAVDLLFVSKLCGEQALWVDLDRNWLPFWDATWTAILETTTKTPSKPSGLKDLHLYSAFILHLIHPMATRQNLVQLLLTRSNSTEPESLVPSCQSLLDSLLHLCNTSNYSIAAPALAFLRCFLSNGQDFTSQDCFARSLWNGFDDQRMKSCIDLVSPHLVAKHQSGTYATDPLMLLLLDVLGTLVSSPEHCRKVVRELCIKRVEGLIQVMEPKRVRVDVSKSFVAMHQGGDDEDTPPANNLSRLDETVVFSEPEQEREPWGLDYAIRYAAGTILAQLARVVSSSPQVCGMTVEQDTLLLDNETVLMLGRARSAVGDFLANLLPLFEASELPVTFDLTRRHLRLEISYATFENQMLVVSVLHSARVLRRRQQCEKNEDLDKFRESLQQARTRELNHEMEKKGWKREMNIKSMCFERELTKTKLCASEDTKQLVQIHTIERSRAERTAVELSNRLQQSEAAINEAQRSLQNHIQAEAETRDALESATAAIQELESKLLVERQLRSKCELEAEQIASELEATTQCLDDAKEQQRLMQCFVKDKEEELTRAQSSYSVLQDNLENLFADITQLYQTKEQELSDARGKNDRALKELKEHLELERGRNEDLERKMRAARHENERLTMKLVRSKEKLEAERKERQEERERRQRLGPISYMNQLHNSTFSDRSGKDRTRDKSFQTGKDTSRW